VILHVPHMTLGLPHITFFPLLRTGHYIPHDVAWHMNIHWWLWWHLYKLQLDNDDMDFMMRWKCQVSFLAASSWILDDRSDLCFIFMKDPLCCLSSPTKGSWINVRILWSIMQCILFVSVHDLLHVSMIALFCSSSPQVFLYAFSLLSTLEHHLVMLRWHFYKWKSFMTRKN